MIQLEQTLITLADRFRREAISHTQALRAGQADAPGQPSVGCQLGAYQVLVDLARLPGAGLSEEARWALQLIEERYQADLRALAAGTDPMPNRSH